MVSGEPLCGGRTIGLLICGLLWAGMMPASAQSRLGAVGERGPIAAPSAATADSAAADSVHRQRAELIAAQLLERARTDIASGQRQIAQRVLEQLIGSFPDAAAAFEARRHLYALYASDNRIWVREHPSSVAASPEFGADSAGLPTVGRASEGAGRGGISASSWRTSIVAFRRLQEELRNGIGDRVFFSAGSADIGSRARALLIAQAEWLLRRPNVEVLIEGHADDASAGVDDDRISLARAAAVRDRLVAEGVSEHRIHVLAHGGRDPVAVCAESDCAAQNRRTVVQVGIRHTEEGGRQ